MTRSARRGGDRDLVGRVLRWVAALLGLTTTGVVVIGLAAAGWLVARQARSRDGLLIAYGAAAALALTWLAERRPLGVAGHRVGVAPRMRTGQQSDVLVEIRAPRGAVDALVTEQLPAQLGGPVELPLPAVGASGRTQLQYILAPRRRGVYEAGPLTVTRSDPFGLVARRAVLAGPVPVIVHPATETVRDRVVSREWEDPPVRPPSSRPSPSGFDLSGLREYVPGDDLRRVAWRAAARAADPLTGEPRYLVRESEQGVTDQVRLLLDTDVRGHSPGDPSETFENAVRVVASLGVRHVGNGSSVRLEGNGGCRLDGVRGEGSRVRLLDDLAAVEREAVPLLRALDRLASERGRPNAHNVVVTPSVDADAAARLRLLAGRGLSVLVVHVLWADSDPLSLRRAIATGCRLVEVATHQPLEAAFARMVGSGGRPHR